MKDKRNEHTFELITYLILFAAAAAMIFSYTITAQPEYAILSGCIAAGTLYRIGKSMRKKL